MTSCAISGHRPTRFKFGYKETHTGCKRLKRVMREQFDLLYQQGVREFYVGGALGVDMWAAEILLRMKEQSAYSDLLLHMVNIHRLQIKACLISRPVSVFAFLFYFGLKRNIRIMGMQIADILTPECC